MKTRFLLGALLLSVCSLTGCSDDNENELIAPFDIGKTYYETRLGRGSTSIDVTNGSGDISLEAADENILQAVYRKEEGSDVLKGVVTLTGKKKGTTSLTLTDNVTGDKETVEVKVTDCYIAYDIIASNHPALNEEMTLFLINNEARDCYFYLKDNPYDRPSATGTYEFFATAPEPDSQLKAIPHLRLSYPSNAEGEFADEVSTHDFQIETLGADATSSSSLEVIEAYLGIDWEELIANAKTKSPAPVDLTVRMTVPGTDYVITGVLSTVTIPEHVLD